MSEVKRHSVTGYGRQDIKYNDPEGEFVYYEDYAALQQNLDSECLEKDYNADQLVFWKERAGLLQQKLDAMAAENAVQKSVIEAVRGVADNSNGIAGWHLNGEIARWDEILPEIEDIETPATDTYLNSVRAEGVDLVKSHPAISLVSLTHICDQIAEKLRSGTHDTADKAG